MTAEIIRFPNLIECIARRMVRVMEVPPGDNYEQERAFDRALDEVGIACEGGIELTDEQWAAVWRRVDELMKANTRVGGGAR